MTIKLGSGTDQQSLKESSWVVFQSKMFSAIHFVRLDLLDELKGDVVKFRDAKNTKNKKFIEVILDTSN